MARASQRRGCLPGLAAGTLTCLVLLLPLLSSPSNPNLPWKLSARLATASAMLGFQAEPTLESKGEPGFAAAPLPAFVVQQNATAASEPKPVQRVAAGWPKPTKPTECPKCGQRRSIILLHMAGKHRKKGLSDRVNVFQELGGMAKMLCALLLVPPPCEMLDAKHNHGARLNCRGIAWDRYLDTDRSSVWRQARPNVSEAGKLVLGADGAGRRVGSNFHTALAAAQQGKQFLWHVYQDFYLEPFKSLWADTVKPRVGQCQSGITVQLSRLAHRLATQFLAAEGLQNGLFNTLHIRRRDGGGCDTSESRVLKYVSCSLTNDSRPVVLFTDEDNRAYVDSIIRGVQQLVSGRKVLYGEPAMKQIVSSEVHAPDNFLVYAVSMAVQGMAARRLQLRRTIHCRDCDPPPSGSKAR